MVRLKNRWLLVRVDQRVHCDKAREGILRECPLPSKREFFALLSEAVLEHFGVTHAGGIRESKVQFSDERSRLILIRTPRTLAPKVRAVLTLMTSLQVTKNKATPVVVSVLGVHGSLRTAKKSVLMCIRHSYMDYLKTLGPRLNEKDKLAVAQSLESVLQTVYEIEV